MALEAVKIPADVQVEEKIIGPVSLRQLGLMLAGGGMGYVIWTSAQANGYAGFPALVAAWTPVIITGAFAFVKISDVSLFRICLLSYEKLHKPAVRTFGPRVGINITVRPGAAQQYKEQKKQDEEAQRKALEAEQSTKSNLAELSVILDKGLDELITKPPQVTKAQLPEDREDEAQTISAEPLDRAKSVDAIQKQQRTEQPKADSPPSKIVRDIAPPK